MNDLGYTNDTLVQVAYSDGFGRVVQTRAQAEEVIFGDQDFGISGLPASQADPNADAVGVENTSPTDVNVVVNGWSTKNNKGMVVEQWEPYYDQGWDYAPPTVNQYGQKVVMYYDSVGRAVRTVNPDGTEQRVVTGVPVALDVLVGFAPTPWESYTYDANDLADLTHSGGGHNVPVGHWWTPRSVVVDALGRMVESTDRNWDGAAVEDVVMRYFYDIRGNKVRVDDALKVAYPGAGRASAFLHVYDLANQPLKTTHVDGGVKTMVINAAGLPVEARDAKGALVLSACDALLRPVAMWARDVTGETTTLRSAVIYGDDPGSGMDETTNHLGRPYKSYDEAGMQEFPDYDFKGQPKYKKRWVIGDDEILDVFDPAPTNWVVSPYRVDWTPLDEGILDSVEFRTDIEYDALGRPTLIRLPEDVNSNRKEIVPSYNRAGAMASITVDATTYVSRIAYNAKGQRLLVAYGNDMMTRHAYDPVNFRLLRQKTEGFTETSLTYEPASGTTKQDCAYTYDLAGNIVGMVDASPDAGVGGSGALSRTFAYDALYRLIQATGREAGTFASSSSPWNEGYYVPDSSLASTRAYTQDYEYDRLGNMLHLHHQASGNTFHRYLNDFANVGVAAFQTSNLATEIDFGGTTVNYAFDANGNQVSEGTSRHMGWDHGDRMRTYATQTGTSEPTVYTHYLYDPGGNRVKKIVRKSSGNHLVTVYIDGGFEYLYEYDGASKEQEMNEVHVMDGRSRIARVREHLVSTWSGPAPETILYNLEDHLGNACFSLTSTGGDYSREEYFPFGETSFRDFGKERYRFCGKERDEESGLYYYGARYYAVWGCRFVSVDPLAAKYPFYTPYQYAGNQPVNSVDLDGLEKDPETSTDGKDKAADDSGVAPSTHIIEKGDTFWDLSRNSGGQYTVQNLRDWNPGVDPEKLQIGQHINITSVDYEWSKNAGEGTIAPADPSSFGSMRYEENEVASEGDFFWKYGPMTGLVWGQTWVTTKTDLNLDIDGGENNKNTFRHAYGSAMMAQRWGEEVAIDG